MRVSHGFIWKSPQGATLELPEGNVPLSPPFSDTVPIGVPWEKWVLGAIGFGFLLGAPVVLAQSLVPQSDSGQSVLPQSVRRPSTRELELDSTASQPLGASPVPRVRQGPPMPQSSTLPPVPKVRTPTDRFRELLAAKPEQREALLSRKTPAARALIEAKLLEFGALRPDEREIRLRLAQFQDSLRTLLPIAPSERGPLMAAVPEEDLPWIEERLVAWDLLTEAERRDVLESERRLSWFVRQAEVSSDRQRVEAYMATLPPAARQLARDQMERWLAFPLTERKRKAAAFSRFFDLTAAERQAALGTLSQTERLQMERALSDFAALTPDARERCVRGFQKFEALSPAEREQFLRRAERWKAMSPNDRAAWRRLVEKALSPTRKPPFPTEDTMLASPPR